MGKIIRLFWNVSVQVVAFVVGLWVIGLCALLTLWIAIILLESTLQQNSKGTLILAFLDSLLGR